MTTATKAYETYHKAGELKQMALERIRVNAQTYYELNKGTMPDFWRVDFEECFAKYEDAKRKEAEAFNGWVDA